MKSCMFILIMFVFSFSLSFCENTDVVYLKNGSIIKGKIIEIKFNKSVKLELSDGSIMVFEQDKIDKIEKNQNSIKKEKLENRGHKSPFIALALSLFLYPGMGQLYNEDTGRGILFLGMSLLSAGMVYDGYRIDDYNDRNNFTEGTIGTVLFCSTWVISSIDAYSSAKRINRNLSMDSKKDLRLSVTSNGIKLSYKF